MICAIIFSFNCCSTHKTITDNTNNIEIVDSVSYGYSMYNAFEREFTVLQFDSICKADKLINDLSKWHNLSVQDEDTKESFVEYLYIKSLGNNECIYRLVKVNNNVYKITKRITRK